MVAERTISSTTPAPQDPMAVPSTGASRQRSLAEEIAEIENAEVVTTALQAVETHGINTSTKPQEEEGVPNTPKRTVPLRGKPPSPVRVDPDGQTWTWEDDDQVPEYDGEEQVRSPGGPGACAGPTGTEDLMGETPNRRPLADIIKTWLYPEGEKVDTPQMRTPASVSVNDSDGSNTSSAEEDWASKEYVDKVKGQVNELRKFVNTMVKNHAKDIDNLKVLARMAQRTNGSIRDDLSESKLEITQTLSQHEQRLTEIENGYKTLNDWAGEVAERADPDDLWGSLAEKDARISELEEQVNELQGREGSGACAGPSTTEDSLVSARLEKLEEWVASIHDDNQQEERMEKIEGMVRNLNSPNGRRRVEADRERKPILDHKAVQNIAQLGYNKD